MQSKPDITPLFFTAICEGKSVLAANRNKAGWGISVQRLSWELSKGGAISGG